MRRIPRRRVRARAVVRDLGRRRKQIAPNLDAREFFARLAILRSANERVHRGRRMDSGQHRCSAGRDAPASISRFRFQPESGAYEIYVSPIQPPDGWAYARGEPFAAHRGRRPSDGQLRILEQEITTLRYVALAADVGGAAEVVRESRAHHRPKPSPHPFHGAPRHSGALSRLIRRRLLDGPESAAAHGDLLFRFRNRACRRASGPIRAAPVSRSTFWPGCCRGSRFPSPWAAPRT